MTAPDMTCQELVEVVTDYLEGRPAGRATPPLRGARRLVPGVPHVPGADSGDDQPDRDPTRGGFGSRVRDALLAVLHSWKHGEAT